MTRQAATVRAARGETVLTERNSRRLTQAGCCLLLSLSLIPFNDHAKSKAGCL